MEEDLEGNSSLEGEEIPTIADPWKPMASPEAACSVSSPPRVMSAIVGGTTIGDMATTTAKASTPSPQKVKPAMDENSKLTTMTPSAAKAVCKGKGNGKGISSRSRSAVSPAPAPSRTGRAPLSVGSVIVTVAFAVSFGVWLASVLRESCDGEMAVIFRGGGRGQIASAMVACAEKLTSREALQQHADVLYGAVKTVCMAAYAAGVAAWPTIVDLTIAVSSWTYTFLVAASVAAWSAAKIISQSAYTTLANCDRNTIIAVSSGTTYVVAVALTAKRFGVRAASAAATLIAAAAVLVYDANLRSSIAKGYISMLRLMGTASKCAMDREKPCPLSLEALVSGVADRTNPPQIVVWARTAKVMASILIERSPNLQDPHTASQAFIIAALAWLIRLISSTVFRLLSGRRRAESPARSSSSLAPSASPFPSSQSPAHPPGSHHNLHNQNLSSVYAAPSSSSSSPSSFSHAFAKPPIPAPLLPPQPPAAVDPTGQQRADSTSPWKDWVGNTPPEVAEGGGLYFSPSKGASPPADANNLPVDESPRGATGSSEASQQQQQQRGGGGGGWAVNPALPDSEAGGSAEASSSGGGEGARGEAPTVGGLCVDGISARGVGSVGFVGGEGLEAEVLGRVQEMMQAQREEMVAELKGWATRGGCVAIACFSAALMLSSSRGGGHTPLVM